MPKMPPKGVDAPPAPSTGAKAGILIGKCDEKNIDAVSSATVRKDKSEVVTYVK